MKSRGEFVNEAVNLLTNIGATDVSLKNVTKLADTLQANYNAGVMNSMQTIRSNEEFYSHQMRLAKSSLSSVLRIVLDDIHKLMVKS